MKTLVIGGTGFLGSGITSVLAECGHQVELMARGNKANGFPQLPFLVCDRSDPAAFAAALGGATFDLVVDCAGYKGADIAAVLPTLAGGIGHFIFISTDFTYSPHIVEIPIREDAPKETQRPYGVGKLECEKLLLESAKLSVTILRPPHILGAGKELGVGSVDGRDKDLLRKMRAGSPITLIAEGLLAIQPVMHREIGQAIAHFAGNPRAFGRAFNMVGPDCVTVRRYYELIAEKLGVTPKWDTMTREEFLRRWPDKAPFARHRIYDPTALIETTGYRPHIPLGVAIAETVEWMGSVTRDP